MCETALFSSPLLRGGLPHGGEGGEEEGVVGREGGAAKCQRRREVLKILSQCGYQFRCQGAALRIDRHTENYKKKIKHAHKSFSLSCFFRVHPLGGLFLAHAEAGLHCTVLCCVLIS